MKFLLTADLHQHIQKWQDLVDETIDYQPDYVLIAGDLLPKEDFSYQKAFFTTLQKRLQAIRDKSPAQVLTYLGNDDSHVLEPMLYEL